MIKLRLCEYNKDGKFEKFLELEKDFMFGGSCIFLELVFNSYDKDGMFSSNIDCQVYHKDEKDPLNRFNGLFNGRTYGEGRFVLIENAEDGIYKITNNVDAQELFTVYQKLNLHCYAYINSYPKDTEWMQHYLGNLHENPELFSKI